MFPPTSGREQDPPAPPPAPPEEDVAGTTYPVRNEGLSARGRIFFFGILVGGSVGVIFSVVSAGLYMFTRPPAMFPQSDETFWRYFAGTFGNSMPWFILIGVIAAAAEALMRQSDQSSRRTARALRRRIFGHESVPPAPPRRAADIVEPLVRDLGGDNG